MYEVYLLLNIYIVYLPIDLSTYCIIFLSSSTYVYVCCLAIVSAHFSTYPFIY
jgi:hypothetical protein